MSRTEITLVSTCHQLSRRKQQVVKSPITVSYTFMVADFVKAVFLVTHCLDPT